MNYCYLCDIPVKGKGGKRLCRECRKRSKNVPSLHILLGRCACGAVGSWLMEEHDWNSICGNCHRALHKRQTQNHSSRRWPRRAKIDVYKSVTTCADCGCNDPDMLLFVKDLKKVNVNASQSLSTITKLINSSTVYCYNCWRTRRRNDIRD